MPPISPLACLGRYLSFAEREEIALLTAQKFGAREIARQLGRSPSTISRKLRRNAATRGGTGSGVIGPCVDVDKAGGVFDAADEAFLAGRPSALGAARVAVVSCRRWVTAIVVAAIRPVF